MPHRSYAASSAKFVPAYRRVAGLFLALTAPSCGDDPVTPPEADGGGRSEQAGQSSGSGGSTRPGDPVAGSAGVSVRAGRGGGGNGTSGVGAQAGSGSAAQAATNSGAGAAAISGSAGQAADSGDPFSFFVASQAGLARLSGNALGFGGDLRFGKPDGLSGADEICRQLAETSLPGNAKTWRAFLSATKGSNGQVVNAIDRIGEGPWYDRKGRLFAMNKAALSSTRPQGIDKLIANDLPNEEGVPNHDPGTGIIDNHNTMTGSSTMGTLDSKGLTSTCQDWTDATAAGGTPRCGTSWPRGQLSHWISALNEGGCAPGATPTGAEGGGRGSVGALGGYGGFYCFALSP